jgi:hypothetical protein
VAKLVVSDPAIHYGRKSIATFGDGSKGEVGTLSNEGAIYLARVDGRVKGINRDGELILGTHLGELRSLEIYVDFKYSAPVADGAQKKGTVLLTKENGETYHRDLSCTRYLKNSRI